MRTGSVAGRPGGMGCCGRSDHQDMHCYIGPWSHAYPAAGSGAVDGRCALCRRRRAGGGAADRFPAVDARGGLHPATGTPSGSQRTVLRCLLATDAEEGVRQSAKLVLAQLEPSTAAPSVFSARELEVLTGVREGLQNKEIAGRLGMTDEGVRYHLKNIYRKDGRQGPVGSDALCAVAGLYDRTTAGPSIGADRHSRTLKPGSTRSPRRSATRGRPRRRCAR